MDGARVKAVGERSDVYTYTYDLFVRRSPATVKSAERLSSADACATLVRRLLDLAGGLTPKQISKLFDWESERTEKVLARLESERRLRRVDSLVVLPDLAR